MRSFNDAAARFRTIWPGLSAWLAASIAVLYVFNRSLSSGFTLLFGDSTDALIEVSILEHWRNVFAHSAHLFNTDYFYPYPDTIGYNDTYFLPGLAYTAMRQMLDPLLAAMATHVILKAFGFAGMYLLLRRGFSSARTFSILGATLFTISNASLMQMYHGQLNQLAFAPWVLVGIVTFSSQLMAGERRKAAFCGASVSLLYGLWALSGFYFVWFATLFAGLTLLGWVVMLPAFSRKKVWEIASKEWLLLASLAAFTALCLTPFFVVYLPRLASGQRHSWETVYAFLPDPITYLNVGPGNLIWGRLFEWMNQTLSPANQISGEDVVGFPLFGIVALVLSTIWLVRQKNLASRPILLAALISVGLICVAMTRLPHHLSLWRLLYQVLPGANGIRAMSRFLIFATIVQAAAVVIWLERVTLSKNVKLLIAASLLVEQVQLSPPVHLDRRATLAMLEAVRPIPEQCNAIFVISARSASELAADKASFLHQRTSPSSADEQEVDSFLSVYRSNVDAMLLAAVRHRPAINGYSTFLPPDWHFVRTSSTDMLTSGLLYARSHKVSRVCVLDRTVSDAWRVIKPA